MKKKIVILAIVIIIIIFCFITWKLVIPKNYRIPEDYRIPENYNLKLEDNKSYVDGADTTYYIYDNKIIVEAIFYYPVGHPMGTKHHRITVYNNVITSKVKEINDVYNLIKNKNGKKVYDEYN